VLDGQNFGWSKAYRFLALRKQSALSRDCGNADEPFPERDEMDDEVFVFFFSLIIPGDHEQVLAVKFLTSPEQRPAFSLKRVSAPGPWMAPGEAVPQTNSTCSVSRERRNVRPSRMSEPTPVKTRNGKRNRPNTGDARTRIDETRMMPAARFR
jgi:hypothetical protein